MAGLGFILFLISLFAIVLGILITIASIFNKGMAVYGRYCLLTGALLLLASFTLCSIGGSG